MGGMGESDCYKGYGRDAYRLTEGLKRLLICLMMVAI